MNKPTMEVKEIVKVELGTENVSLSFGNLPPELLEIFLDWFKNAHAKRPDRNKQLAQMRLVCSQWKNVIDGSALFEPVISNKLINGNNRLDHVRAKKCAVSNLTHPLMASQIPVFFRPEWIEEVSFGESDSNEVCLSGGVSKQAFLVLAEHFNKSCNVKSVKVYQGFKRWSSEVLELESNLKILNEFWGKVEKLDLNIPFDDLMVWGWKEDRHMIEILRSAEMSKLEDLKVTGHWRLLITPLIISFLFRHPGVKNLCLQLEPYEIHLWSDYFLNEEHTAEIEFLYWNLVKQVSVEDMEKIQLKKFTIKGPTMCHIVRYTWMPLILAQRKLEKLKLTHISQPLQMYGDFTDPLPFVDFIPVLQNNKSTLTFLELLKFQFNKVVDFSLFQGLCNLRTLKLSKNTDELVSKIVNMNTLPGSLEKLSIEGFGCLNIQLKHFAKASHMNKLSNLELVYIRHLNCNQIRAIPEEIVKDFLEMKSLFFLSLDSFTIIRAQEGGNTRMEGNRKYFVIDKGQSVHWEDNWTLFKRYVASCFTIMCKDIKES